MKNEQHLGLLYIFVTLFLWGFLAIALKLSLFYIDLESAVWFRFVFAFVALVGLFLIKRPTDLKFLFNPPKLSLLAALGLAINYYFFFKGLALTSPSNAQIFIQIGPIGFALMGVLVLKERMTNLSYLGLLLAIFGLGLFYREQWKQTLASEELYHMGSFFVVLGALGWILYAFFQQGLTRRYPPQQLNLIIYGVPALLLLPIAKWQSFTQLNLMGWFLIVFLGLNTLLAYGALGEALKRLPANQVGMLIPLNPLITLVLMHLIAYWPIEGLQAENLSRSGWVGALLLILGSSLVIGFRAKTPKSAR